MPSALQKRIVRQLAIIFNFSIMALNGSALAVTGTSNHHFTYRARYVTGTGSNTAELVSFSRQLMPPYTPAKTLRQNTLPSIWTEAGDVASKPDTEIHEIESSDHDEIVRLLSAKGISAKAIEKIDRRNALPAAENHSDDASDEVRTLIDSGPAVNRIDLVFMGDGYTAAERDKFHADINRLVDEMFLGDTFKSYLPVLNVHSVFRPSNQSGIGKGSPADTAYRLYREGETLRAIFPGNTGALRDSCGRAPDCDYPIVIANDPDYGGLGGEFAISTSSVQSGTVVLRHELGHNFGRVGEEYDGGGYFGANHSSEATQLSWRHWIPDGYRARPEPMYARFLGWPWHQFSKGDFTAKFRSDGKQSRAAIRFSASGFAKAGYLRILLDGKRLPFREPASSDRTFIDIDLPQGFPAGEHQVVFASAGDDEERKRHWLSSLTIHEYAVDFPEASDLTSAFPVFDSSRLVAGYRPTNESCLMRNMLHSHFCDVCQENNWLKFLNRIEMIDTASHVANSEGIVSARVATLPLGQFRQLGEGPAGEKIGIKWYADGNELEQFRDIRDWQASEAINAKELEVEVTLVTPEIRRDALGITSKRIDVPAANNDTGSARIGVSP